MRHFDEVSAKNHSLVEGTKRQHWAVNEVRKKGGFIYYPTLSNFRPRIVGCRVIVHSHVWIGDEVELADDMKIQAFAFIPNGVSFEAGVFIGPHVIITNDRVPPSNDFCKTLVKRGASLGAGAIIICGNTIGEGALIGAGAVVTRDVPSNEVWVGNPARFLRKRIVH